MKNDILKILIQERREAERKAEAAKRNADLVSMLAYKKFWDLIQRLIRTIQDHG